MILAYTTWRYVVPVAGTLHAGGTHSRAGWLRPRPPAPYLLLAGVWGRLDAGTGCRSFGQQADRQALWPSAQLVTQRPRNDSGSLSWSATANKLLVGRRAAAVRFANVMQTCSYQHAWSHFLPRREWASDPPWTAPCPSQSVASSLPHLSSLGILQGSRFLLHLSALPNCTALRRLSLMGVEVASLEPLAHCRSLDFIFLSYISFGVAPSGSGDAVGAGARAPCRSLLRDILRAGPAKLPALREVELRGLTVATDTASQPGSAQWAMAAAASGPAGPAGAAGGIGPAGAPAAAAPAVIAVRDSLVQRTTSYVRLHELVSLYVRWPRLRLVKLDDADGLTERVLGHVLRHLNAHQGLHHFPEVCGERRVGSSSRGGRG